MSVRAKRRGLPALLALLALGGAMFAALTLGLTGALAATADTQYDVVPVDSPDPQNGAGFGARLAAADDATGDGVPDVFVSSNGQTVDSVRRAGMVSLIDGATREIVYSVTSPDGPEERASFGFEVAVIGDVNGDGLDDFAVGNGRATVDGNAGQGRLYVFDGRTGEPLYTVDNPDPQPSARFGDYASAAGDVTGDGIGDIIVSAVANDFPAGCGARADGSAVPRASLPPDCRVNEGQTYLIDGSDGSLVRTFNLPDRPPPSCNSEVQEGGANFNVCGSFGFAPRSVGDMTGDGVPDQMVPAGSLRPDGDRTRQGRIYVFDGANGELLTRIDQPSPDANALWGFNDLGRFTPGDLNGDGVPEIYGTGIRLDGPNDVPDAGRVYIFDGKASLEAGEGVVLYEINPPNPQPAAAFGFPANRTDYNKDGTTDLYISSISSDDGKTHVFDGRDGSLLKTLALPATETQQNMEGNSGSGLVGRALGDVNGDGEPDFVAGASGQDVNGVQSQGRVFFFLSNVPDTAAAPVPPVPAVPPVAACLTEDTPGFLHPAKLRVSRAQVLPSDRRLDVFAPITSRARGDVEVTYQADRRSDTFDAEVTSGNAELDRIRFMEPITRGQARLGTGIVTLNYQGDEDTRAEEVRLRAASQRAELDVEEISLSGDRLAARGSVTSRAEGIVRLSYSYLDGAGEPQVHLARATIDDDGDWELKGDKVPSQLAQCGGYLSIQFTGFFERRIRGEQLAYQLNAGQTRRP